MEVEMEAEARCADLSPLVANAAAVGTYWAMWAGRAAAAPRQARGRCGYPGRFHGLGLWT